MGELLGPELAAIIPPRILAPLAETVLQHFAIPCTESNYAKMDHLACFLPGTLALGAMMGAALDAASDLRMAAALVTSCMEMYNTTSGLAPESVNWRLFPGDSDGPLSHLAGSMPGGSLEFLIADDNAHSLLRPETVESLWYMYVATGDVRYQDWGWQ